MIPVETFLRMKSIETTLLQGEEISEYDHKVMEDVLLRNKEYRDVGRKSTYIEKTININGINHWIKMSLKHNSKYPIIVVHGGPGGSNYVFEETPGKKLEQFMDIIYYEQRGCGRSDKAIDINYRIEVLVNDLNTLIKELGFEKVILLGYSFGAELVLEYSLKYPSKVHKLVLQAPTDFADMKMMYRIQFEGFNSLNVCFNELESDDIVKKYDFMWHQISSNDVNRFLFYDINKAEEVRKLWIESEMINSGLMSNQVMNRKRNETVLTSSKTIMIPTLILIGKHDKNVGVELATQYAENIKYSQLEVFDVSGHFPDYEESVRYHFILLTPLGLKCLLVRLRGII